MLYPASAHVTRPLHSRGLLLVFKTAMTAHNSTIMYICILYVHISTIYIYIYIYMISAAAVTGDYTHVQASCHFDAVTFSTGLRFDTTSCSLYALE